MTREQANVEKVLRNRVSTPVNYFTKVTISLADEMPDVMGLPKFSSRDNLRDRIMFLIAKESK